MAHIILLFDNNENEFRWAQKKWMDWVSEGYQGTTT